MHPSSVGSDDECSKQARAANEPLAKAQWVLFADEWLKQVLAAEALAKREAVEPVAAK